MKAPYYTDPYLYTQDTGHNCYISSIDEYQVIRILNIISASQTMYPTFDNFSQLFVINKAFYQINALWTKTEPMFELLPILTNDYWVGHVRTTKPKYKGNKEYVWNKNIILDQALTIAVSRLNILK